MNIGWLCNSGVVRSETYLVDNLEILQKIGQVRAICGNLPSTQNPHSSIDYKSFDHLPMKPWHAIASRVIGYNVRNRIKKIRCVKACFDDFKRFGTDLLWVEFGTTAFNASLLIEQLNVPYFVSIHGFDVSSAFRDSEYKHFFQNHLKHATGVICASKFIRNKCIANGIPEEKCFVIDLVVKTPEIDFSNQKKTLFPSFVHFGRLVEGKGLHITLRAFQKALTQLPDARFSVIGNGHEEPALRQLVSQLGLTSSVDFLGPLDRESALCIVSQHWIVCQHSISDLQGSQEGFGLTLAESGSLGIPAISTTHGGIPEHITNRASGILVAEYDIDAMAAAMVELGNNGALLGQLGNKAKKFYQPYTTTARELAIRKLMRDKLQTMSSFKDV
jgi:colanic acid/amylovoran biosynthesis glycosyltransferase